MLLSHKDKATMDFLLCTSRGSRRLMVSPTVRGCDHRLLANISCNLREIIVPLQTSPAICGRPSYPYKHLLQLAGDHRTPTYHLLQLAGDHRTPTYHLLQLAGDHCTPTYHLLQLAGDHRTPTKVSARLRYAGRWPRYHSAVRRAYPDGFLRCTDPCEGSGNASGEGH